MNFGNILRYLREKQELSQVELAKQLNITSQALSQYELNKRMPDIEMIKKIADFFDVSIDFLLGRTDIKKQERLPVKESLEEYCISSKIIKDINGLSPESQKDLEEYIKLLKLRDMQKRNKENSDELATLD